MADARFGETLRALRLAKGLTQEEVAKILSKGNKSTVGSWEIGKSEPDAYTFLKLCRLYGVEDIYAAFDEASETPLPATDERAMGEKFARLKQDYKVLVSNQVDMLLKIEKKAKRESTEK